MKFETELKKGNFVVGECTFCNKIIWPPSDLCNNCFREPIWRNLLKNEGTIIEFSEKGGNYFCLAEFENTFRIVGNILAGMPVKGQKVKIQTCGKRNENYYFEFVLV